MMLDLILNALHESGIAAINIYKDWYWTIAYEEAYHTLKKPTECEIGSLVDDWEWLEKVLCKENPSTTLDFERLGNVIRILKKNVYPEETKSKCLVFINLSDVAKLVTQILQKTDKAGFDTISTNINTYWAAKPEDEYNFNQEPAIIEKSFSEDWNYLKNNLSDSNATSSDVLESFSRLLMIIGEEIKNSPLIVNWLVCEQKHDCTKAL